jgi:hypothetical protein
MKRAAIVVVLLVVAFLAYRRYDSSWAPVRRYKAFANEVLHRRYDAAAAMADGLTAVQIEKVGSQEQIGAGPPMFQTLFPSIYRIESQESAADGSVTLRGEQMVLFNPVGVESVRPAMYAKLNQVVQLRKGGEGWKVVAFENKFVTMDSMTGR